MLLSILFVWIVSVIQNYWDVCVHVWTHIFILCSEQLISSLMLMQCSIQIVLCSWLNFSKFHSIFFKESSVLVLRHQYSQRTTVKNMRSVYNNNIQHIFWMCLWFIEMIQNLFLAFEVKAYQREKFNYIDRNVLHKMEGKFSKCLNWFIRETQTVVQGFIPIISFEFGCMLGLEILGKKCLFFFFVQSYHGPFLALCTTITWL